MAHTLRNEVLASCVCTHSKSAVLHSRRFFSYSRLLLMAPCFPLYGGRWRPSVGGFCKIGADFLSAGCHPLLKVRSYISILFHKTVRLASTN